MKTAGGLTLKYIRDWLASFLRFKLDFICQSGDCGKARKNRDSSATSGIHHRPIGSVWCGRRFGLLPVFLRRNYRCEWNRLGKVTPEVARKNPQQACPYEWMLV